MKNTKVKYKYLKIAFEHSIWVNILNYFPPLENILLCTELHLFDRFSF